MKAAFIGYGELGLQIHHYAEQCYNLESSIYFDDIAFAKNVKNSFRFSDHSLPEFGDYSFFIGLGYHHLALRRKIISGLLALKRSLPYLIHPTCYRNPTASIGKAVYVYPMCTIDKDVKIGTGTILNIGVILSHNTSVGESCYLSPGVVTSGNVSIGNETFLGTRTVISNNITVGDRCVLGVGSVVNTNLPDNKYAIGSPLVIKENGFNLV
jgi:sugar O-acyltransferase (sialic acid O-acetyltransferase NeuD family)